MNDSLIRKLYQSVTEYDKDDLKPVTDVVDSHKQLQRRFEQEWSSQFSSNFKEINRLEKEKLTQAEPEQLRNRSSIIYSLALEPLKTWADERSKDSSRDKINNQALLNTN